MAVMLVVAWSLIPFYFLIVVSLLPPGSAAIGYELPRSITLGAYARILLGSDSVFPYLINSCVIGGIATAIVIVLSLPAAYVFSRWNSRTSTRLYLSFFVLRMVPVIALTIPYFIFWKSLGIIDTKGGLVISYLPIGLPLGIWLLKGFIDMIPKPLEEAAKIDGATMPQVILRIILPLSLQGVAVASAFVFLGYYIEYMLALTLTDFRAVTFPIYVTGFIDQNYVDLQGILAAGLIGIIPMLILCSVLQRYLRKGVIFGAIR